LAFRSGSPLFEFWRFLSGFDFLGCFFLNIML
jgi:hypothetical protein